MADLASEIRTNQYVTEARLADLSENVESVLQKQAEYMHMLEKDQALSKQEVIDLIRVRQRSLDNTEQEWNEFFRPILSNLERVVKRRILHVIEEKLSCEKKMAEGDPVVTSSDFDLDSEWAAFELSLLDSGDGNAVDPKLLKTLEDLSSLKDQLRKAISYPNEVPLAFYYLTYPYEGGHPAGVKSYASFMYVITSRSVYKLRRSLNDFPLRNVLVPVKRPGETYPAVVGFQPELISPIPYDIRRFVHDHHYLVYRFSRPLTTQLAKIIVRYVAAKRRPTAPIALQTGQGVNYQPTPLSGQFAFYVREQEAFATLLTSIPGTLYSPLQWNWKSIEAEDGSMTYTNTDTGRIVYEPPYHHPPVVYE